LLASLEAIWAEQHYQNSELELPVENSDPGMGSV